MKKVIDVSIRRRVTVAMFTIAVLLFGFVSFSRLKINLLPELTYPTLTIRTEYEGAAPVEIENLITKPIEEIVGVVKNVQKISSISRSGQSDVILEFTWGTDMDYSVLEIREKMDAMELPLEVKRPVILRFDPSLDPILRLGLSKESGKDEEKLKSLRRFADERIKKELESVLGVAAVRVSGGLEDEVQVLVDQLKLAQLNLPINRVAEVLGSENINLSGGRLEEGGYQFLIRTLNQFQSVPEIGNVVLDYRNSIPVYLKDVAAIRQGFKERQAVTRMNGREAVEIAIYKEGDANTVAVSRAVEKRLQRINEVMPADLKLIEVYDQAVFIEQAVNEVVYAGLTGGLLAIFILYFFLQNFWATVIISLSIPVSVIATFNLMYGANLTLNIMSLGGIALGIGMLVDNSIVVLENISRHREKGKDAKSAVRDGASEVSTAVTASTLTTIAVFFPLVFVKGVAGQLFRDQALTITFSLLVSLLVALTLIPMLASTEKKRIEARQPTGAKLPTTRLGRFFRAMRRFIFTSIPVFSFGLMFRVARFFSRAFRSVLNPALRIFYRGYSKIEKEYPRFLEWSLRHRIVVLAVASGLLVMTIGLIPHLGLELIPQLSQGEFRVEFRLPPGTPLEKTDQVISSVQKSAEKIKNIKTSFSVAGTGNRFDANPEHGGENWGELSVALLPGSKRLDEEVAMKGFREIIEGSPGVEYKFYRPTLFSFKTPVEVEVAGFDMEKLRDISREISETMSKSGRFTDIKSSMDVGHPEIQIRFDRQRAAALALNVYEIADTVVKKIRGDVATRYSWHDRRIDVLVRSREEDRASLKDIRQLIINPESEHPIPLEAVADIIIGTGPSEIRRVDQERVALISSNLNYGDLGSAAEELTEIIRDLDLPRGMTAEIAGQNEEMNLSFRSLRFALLLAIFLVYLVMASQFESFIHPFVIIFTIPLAFIGAVLALWITGTKISVVVFIGSILLAGIVVNNAIVLIDRINQIREKGEAKIRAISQAGKERLRPIIMTMLTTVLGLLPLALGIGEGAEVRAPMAITVIGGLTVSTFLTLIVIPVVYSLADRKK